MCGIVCSYGYTRSQNERGLKSISHRGPDGIDSSTFTIHGDKFLTLGHVRLSILDLDKRSDQPFTLDGERVLCFNGEIYNYIEIKRKFLADHELFTKSDTEILWLLMTKYGTDYLGELQGMFAFTYYDSINQELIIVRDSLGIKPLYFHITNDDRFIVSSEIKAFNSFEIPLKVCAQDVSEYLKFGFVNEPNTGFDGIRKIKPGEVLKYSFKSNSWESQFISVKSGSIDIESRIKESILLHQRADVNQALFYSGGIDSSLLLSMMDKSMVYPIIYSSEISHLRQAGFSNDALFAKAILSDMHQGFHEVVSDIGGRDLIQDMKFIAHGIEELTSDYTFVASYELCKEVGKRGYSVAHSGMGADEMFGGYPRYLAFILVNSIPNWLKFITPLLSVLGSKKSGRLLSAIKAKETWNRYFSLISVFDSSELSELLTQSKLDNLEKRCKHIWEKSLLDSELKTAINCDLLGFLSHNFIVSDKSSMLASIELRVPLATQSIHEWFKQAKNTDLISGLTTKPILRNVLFNRIDKKFFKRKKAGFNPPLDAKINKLGAENILEILNTSKIGEYINLDIANRIVHEHYQKRKNNTYKIYNLLFLAIWLDVHS